jgi:hypothetical protein
VETASSSLQVGWVLPRHCPPPHVHCRIQAALVASRSVHIWTAPHGPHLLSNPPAASSAHATCACPPHLRSLLWCSDLITAYHPAAHLLRIAPSLLAAHPQAQRLVSSSAASSNSAVVAAVTETLRYLLPRLCRMAAGSHMQACYRMQHLEPARRLSGAHHAAGVHTAAGAGTTAAAARGPARLACTPQLVLAHTAGQPPHSRAGGTPGSSC